MLIWISSSKGLAVGNWQDLGFLNSLKMSWKSWSCGGTSTLTVTKSGICHQSAASKINPRLMDFYIFLVGGSFWTRQFLFFPQSTCTVAVGATGLQDTCRWAEHSSETYFAIKGLFGSILCSNNLSYKDISLSQNSDSTLFSWPLHKISQLHNICKPQ